LIRFEEGYGVEGEEAKLQPEKEGATVENNMFFPTAAENYLWVWR
jgi:hypothetical protein